MNNFSLNAFSVNDVKKELQNLSSSKATQISDIPNKIIHFFFYHFVVNNSLYQFTFPHNLKFLDVTPVY